MSGGTGSNGLCCCPAMKIASRNVCRTVLLRSPERFPFSTTLRVTTYFWTCWLRIVDSVSSSRLEVKRVHMNANAERLSCLWVDSSVGSVDILWVLSLSLAIVAIGEVSPLVHSRFLSQTLGRDQGTRVTRSRRTNGTFFENDVPIVQTRFCPAKWSESGQDLIY